MNKIAFIGVGIMGKSMVRNLMKAGYSLTIYSRTKAKCEDVIAEGAVWADTVADCVRDAEAVFSIVGYPSDVEAVLIGENGAVSGMAQGGIICDMTTSSPTLAQTIAAVAAEKGIMAMDAPVTGGDVGARKATLSIFVGGAEEGYTQILPMLQVMGQKIMHCGAAGLSQQAKLANQAAVAGVMFSVCESLLYAAKAGLDVRKWHELVSCGAAGSVAMQTLGQRMMDGDFEPGFFIDHFVKDLGLVLEECRRMHLVLPGCALADQFYRSMQGRDLGKKGTQALIQALAEFSGTVWTAVPKA